MASMIVALVEAALKFPKYREIFLVSALSISLTSSLRPLHASLMGLIVLTGDTYPQHLEGLPEAILLKP
jgi:hypothetical protein